MYLIIVSLFKCSAIEHCANSIFLLFFKHTHLPTKSCSTGSLSLYGTLLLPSWGMSAEMEHNVRVVGTEKSRKPRPSAYAKELAG